MSISNAQYDEIMRTYEEKQNRSRHLLTQRTNEVYAKIPEYKALDSSVADISLEQGRRLIDGDVSALPALKDKLREIVRHEFRHHMENLAGMYGADSLEHEDIEELKKKVYSRK